MFCVLHAAVEHMQKEWGYLAKSLHNEPQVRQLHASAARYSSFSIYLLLCMKEVDDLCSFWLLIDLSLCIYSHTSFVIVVFSVLLILPCREPWKKSRKPSTGMFLISLWHTQILHTFKLNHRFYHLSLTGLCSVLASRLRVSLGRHCWTNTGVKQRKWKGERVWCPWGNAVVMLLVWQFCLLGFVSITCSGFVSGKWSRARREASHWTLHVWPSPPSTFSYRTNLITTASSVDSSPSFTL